MHKHAAAREVWALETFFEIKYSEIASKAIFGPKQPHRIALVWRLWFSSLHTLCALRYIEMGS